MHINLEASKKQLYELTVEPRCTGFYSLQPFVDKSLTSARKLSQNFRRYPDFFTTVQVTPPTKKKILVMINNDIKACLPMSVFKHCPDAVSHIRLQRNRDKYISKTIQAVHQH